MEEVFKTLFQNATHCSSGCDEMVAQKKSRYNHTLAGIKVKHLSLCIAKIVEKNFCGLDKIGT